MKYVDIHLSLLVMSAGDAWIGGTDEGHEGTWVWSHFEDTFTYSNWNSGKRLCTSLLEFRFF